VEREETLNTPLWGGFWLDTDVQRDNIHRGSKHSSSKGECQHSGPGRSGEGTESLPPSNPSTTTPFHTNQAMSHHQELATAAAAVGGGVGSWGDERDWGN